MEPLSKVRFVFYTNLYSARAAAGWMDVVLV